MNRPCKCDNVGPAEFDVNSSHCYACWCWYYRSDMRKMWGGPEDSPALPLAHSKPPGLFRMAANFASALGTYAASGFENAPNDVKRVRLEICEPCEEFTENRKCRACGCFMDWKAGWAAMHCPKGKWAAYSRPPDSSV